MQGTASQSSLNDCEESDGRERKELGKKLKEKEVGNEIDEISNRFQRMNTTKRETELSWAKHGLWRQEQKSRAAKLVKQLKARRELEALIEEQLNRFHGHYNEAMVPRHLEDVSKLLMPQWAAPQELATLSWLGDWRPSAILELLHCPAPSCFLSDSTAMKQVLSKLIHEIRIEETVIDEEIAEIQATCVLYLPFAPVKSRKSGGSALHGIRAEFKKIARVITKAQKLRFKALELVVKKVLNQTDVAEFLVAFSGIQDAIHQFAEHQRLRKGPVTVKPRDVVDSSKQPKIHLEDRISFWEKTSLSLEQERSCQAIEDAIRQFEEQQGLQKGPVTLSVKSQDVFETSKQPEIHLEDNISFWEKFTQCVEQGKSRQEIQNVINQFEKQQGLRKGPVTLSVKSQDQSSKDHLEDRISFQKKANSSLEQERSSQEQ